MMKILLIHHRVPFPLHSGMDKVRYNLIRALSTLYNVTLIVPTDENTPEGLIEHVRAICHNLIVVEVRNNIDRIRASRWFFVKRWMKHIFRRIPLFIIDHFYQEVADVIADETIRGNYKFVQTLSDYTSEYIKYISPQCRIFHGPLDDSVESARSNLRVATSYKDKFFWFLKYRARLSYQPDICARCDWVFFFTKRDLDHLRTLTRSKVHMSFLPTAVESDDPLEAVKKKNEPQIQNSLVFVGGLGSFFNQAAVLHFYNKIFPLIKIQIPDVSFYIVGQNPPEEIKELASASNIIVTGRVPSIVPYIRKAQVYVAPVYSGTGFKTKMVEALGLGKAIVATKDALQGLWDLGHDAMMICDADHEYAEAVIRLLKDEDLRRHYERNARELFLKSYKYEVVLPRIIRAYKQIEERLFSEEK